MLNTLNACVVVAVVAVVAATATGCGMSYIPSHEAIAGDGMTIGIWMFYVFILVWVHAFRCFCTAKNKYIGSDYSKTMHSVTRQRRRWSAKYKKSIDCRAPRGFSQRQYCKYGRNNRNNRNNNKSMRR
jgi:hypothetical protein